MEKQCKVCKAVFDAGRGSRAQCCSDACRKEWHRSICRQYWHKNKGEISLKRKFGTKKSNHAEHGKGKSISEIQRKAREEGLTYGQYVAKYGV